MGTAERRRKMMKILCRRRYETIGNLASEFGVSMRTIQRDIMNLKEFIKPELLILIPVLPMRLCK